MDHVLHQDPGLETKSGTSGGETSSMEWIKEVFSHVLLLVTNISLYAPLCRSVGLTVRPSITLYLVFISCTRLMGVGLVRMIATAQEHTAIKNCSFYLLVMTLVLGK